MAWADLEVEIRSRLAETSATGFWVSADLQRWYNTGAQLFHRRCYQKALSLEARGFGQLYENDYLQNFLRRHVFYLTAGVSDYVLPSDYWRMVRVMLGGSPPIPVEPVNWADDVRVRSGGLLAPTPRQPRYSIIPEITRPLIRFYVAHGQDTIPNFPMLATLHYLGEPIRVNLVTSPPIEGDIPDPFNDGPIAWACHLAMVRERTDSSVFKADFQEAVDTAVPGPSVETP